MLVHVGEYIDSLDGQLGVIQNPSSTHPLVINRIDFYDSCLGFKKNSKQKRRVELADLEGTVPDDSTASPLQIRIMPDEIFDAKLEVSSKILGVTNVSQVVPL